MTAQLIPFPNAPAEPPVNPLQTLADAQREMCYALLADTRFDGLAEGLRALHAAKGANAQVEALIELEAVP